MSEIDDQTQANVALTLDEKITDRVRKALVEVLNRGSGDLYVQDQIDGRIRSDLYTMLMSDYQIREMIKTVVKQTITEQMTK